MQSKFSNQPLSWWWWYSLNYNILQLFFITFSLKCLILKRTNNILKINIPRMICHQSWKMFSLISVLFFYKQKNIDAHPPPTWGLLLQLGNLVIKKAVLFIYIYIYIIIIYLIFSFLWNFYEFKYIQTKIRNKMKHDKLHTYNTIPTYIDDVLK